MICEELMHDACPCVLADIGHCRCCSLLMGKEFCQCDYPGFCIYDKHRWEEVRPSGEHDQIIAYFPCGTATGMIVQWHEAGSATPGLRLTLRQPGQAAVCGTVLRLYPEKSLLYLAVTGPNPALVPKAPAGIEAGGNVFGRDAVHLLNADGQSIQIIADNDLLALVTVLADGLKAKAASVSVTGINSKRLHPAADLLLFVSRDQAALRQALKAIPRGSKARSAFWFVS